jgi:hypothetical protein
MSGAVYERVKDQYPVVAPVELSLKGKSARVVAHRVTASDGGAVPGDLQTEAVLARTRP